MTGRQVRLDPDTEQLVEAEQDRTGGSLSAAANRLLRAAAPARPSAECGPATVTRAPDRTISRRRL